MFKMSAAYHHVLNYSQTGAKYLVKLLYSKTVFWKTVDAEIAVLATLFLFNAVQTDFFPY